MKRDDENVASDNTPGIAREIMEYLQDNPNSMDNLEGITNWWLQSETVTSGNVQKALDYLETKNLIKKTKRTSGDIYYSLKPEDLHS